jgi:malonyl-CoA/methylmalonyl-CoA synthetase
MNLYQTLAQQFPLQRQACAIEAWGNSPEARNAPLYYSWDDLERGSARIANLLAGFGLPVGSRVLMQVEKSVEALMFYLGALRAGLVTVPLNTAYQHAEVEYFISDAEPAIAVCTPGNFPWLSKLAFKRGTLAVFTLGDDRTGSLLERAAHCADTFETVDVDDFELAAILYTSGTTGRSKGAMLSHVNLASNAMVLRDAWGWRYAGWSDEAEGGGRDVLLNALPLFHVHGLFVACHGALIAGAKQIFLPRLDTKKILEVLPRCTMMMGVPTFYVRLLLEAGLNEEVCRNVRLFISGSAPLLVETFNDFRERTGHTILERYGMSETIMLTSNPYHGDPATRKAGTVGRPLHGVDVRVMDGERPCNTGEIGGIEVRGPNVFKGYWRMPEKTKEEFAVDDAGSRWFKTGDVGSFDEDGYLSIVGRSKDLIITGGYNVYPKEIEGYIDELPGVAESAVIGVPHVDFGEAVVAVVVPRPDAFLAAEAIIATLKNRIANFKVPKSVHIVNELPRNTMGKVQKKVLRETYGS